jgi:hypothetical protein
VVGVSFLIAQLPINLYAGTILSDAAGFVEQRQARVSHPNDSKLKQQHLLQQNGKNESTRLVTIQEHSQSHLPSKIAIGDANKNDYQAVSIDVEVDVSADDNSLVEDIDDDEEEDDAWIHRTYTAHEKLKVEVFHEVTD